ncbi:MAG: hypothetical protein HFG42_17400 [Lachnospiraceae bacterium]|jgi:hypothetical protein|nr:hypothetical protein [Lachnospiraceae bacterium]
MANNGNLIPFNKRSVSEAREYGRKGGKASGKARRQKADFRKTLNLLLSAEIDSEEWTPFLESLGIDSTLEAAVNAAMIREALSGNVKAYLAIKDVLGQTSKSDADIEEQQLRMAAVKAKMGVEEEREEPDDGFLDALKGSLEKDWEGFEPRNESESEDEDKETNI